MNYRHAFHAGNFADVFKHLILSRLLVYLTRKPAPLRYIDTHAGLGVYDLSGPEPQRTGEWRDGVGRLKLAEGLSGFADFAGPYLSTLKRLNDGPDIRLYPGSPMVAASLLRPTDRLVLCELHPEDVGVLKRSMGRDRRIKTIEIDGYTGLNAFVPPPEKRGLVLIDPPFEDRAEFDRLTRALVSAWTKWRTGVYAVWYPIKHPSAVEDFCNALVRSGIRKVLRVEIETQGFDPDAALSGCGMAIVNPTHGLDDELRRMLPDLARLLATGPGAKWRADWLVGE